MKKLVLACAMSALASGIASTAALASTVTATISGTMLNGTDFNGLFFAPGTDMTGQTISLTYHFDTAAGTVSPFGTGDWLFANNGSATLTLNGHSEFILNNQTASPTDSAFNDSGALLDLFVNHTDAGIESQVEAYLSAPFNGSGLPATIFDSYDQTDCPAGISCQGSFSITPTGTTGTGGSFGVSSFKYDVTAVAATPIPPALPLFVSALGGLGFLGWRRKAAAV